MIYIKYVSMNWVRIGSRNGLLALWHEAITWLIKSNRPLDVSVSQKQGNRLSDLKFLGSIAHVMNVLLTEFQIRSMSHIATMGMWTNGLFAVQIQVCQLVAEPRNIAGCVIYVVHVNSIECFVIDIFNTTFVTKKCTRLFKITMI